MNIEELKALASTLGDSKEDGPARYIGQSMAELIAQLEDAQSENRALLATEQNLRDRVEALEEALQDLAEAGAEAWGEHRPCVATAFDLLEKQK